MNSISDLIINKPVNDLTVIIIKKLTVVNPKNNKAIYKYVFFDEFEYIQLTQFTQSSLEIYKEGSIVTLSGYMVSPETKNSFWFKLNARNVCLISNNACKIKQSTSKLDSSINYKSIMDINAMVISEKTLISIKAIVLSIKQSEFNGKKKQSLILLDIKDNMTIEALFWDFNTLFKENYSYEFNNIVVENITGIRIGKVWCSTFKELKKVYFI